LDNGGSPQGFAGGAGAAGVVIFTAFV
jgi:hypothetical protein